MANTVSTISYANTFGEWMVATDALINENNILAAGDYTKTSGTLYLNEATQNSLQANGTVIVQKELRVQGIGSSATVQNNMNVGNQLYLTNSSLSLVASGQANIAGPVFATATGTGLTVANNFIVGGNSTFGGTVTVNNNVTVNNISSIGKTYSDTIFANNYITTPVANIAFANITGVLAANTATAFVGDLYTLGQLTVGGNFVINGTTVYNANVFQLNAGSDLAQDSEYEVNRGSSGVPAAIRWEESNSIFTIKNVSSNNYYRILTNEYFNDNLTSTSVTSVATANSVNAVTNIAIAAGSYGNSGFSKANSAYARANASVQSIVGTDSASISPTNPAGVLTFATTNGVTVVGSGSTLTVSTPQDVRTTATPTFNNLTLTNALPITQGGTGSTSAASALTALLPSGTTAGYVLTTGGPGSFYWSPGGTGGGGGAVPGTTINSTRLFPSITDGQVLFTTPEYTPGASQLRVYVNGVRQYNSEYTETSNTSVTLGTGVTTGDVVMLEVDGYIYNPYYANNIAYGPTGDIPASANTIQLGIDNLESRKAALAGATFTGQTIGLTMDANTSNTSFATTAFVKNVLNSGNTFSMSIANTRLVGVITAPQLANTQLYGISISGTASNITNYTINQSVGISSNVQFGSIGVGVSASGVNGEIRAVNDITAFYSSDIRFKENVREIPNALSKVDHIGGKLFDWNEEYISKRGGEDSYFLRKEDFGVIAQDVQEVFPIATRTRPDGSLAVDYEKLCALAFAAIKELKQEIDALKGNNK